MARERYGAISEVASCDKAYALAGGSQEFSESAQESEASVSG